MMDSEMFRFLYRVILLCISFATRDHELYFEDIISCIDSSNLEVEIFIKKIKSRGD